MGIRETINGKPGVTTAVSVGFVAVAFGLVAYQLFAAGRTDDRTARVFLSTDDGKTFFRHDSRQIPPFTLDGKEAVMAKVYECDGKQFVGYLSKYAPEAKQRLEKLQQEKGVASVNAVAVTEVREHETLFKKPGGKDWVNAFDPAAGKVLQVRCDDGRLPRVIDP